VEETINRNERRSPSLTRQRRTDRKHTKLIEGRKEGRNRRRGTGNWSLEATTSGKHGHSSNITRDKDR